MSQVKKNIPMMQGGGAAPGQQTQTSTPKSYGKFIMNGQEEKVTDDLINQFSGWLSSQPREVQTSLAGVRKKLQAGEDVNFDAHAQELSDNTELPLNNERQDARMRKKRSGMGMLFDALTNNNIHKNAVAMDAMSGFKYNKPGPPAPPKPTNINFSKYEVDYNPSEDGKSRTFSSNPTNTAAADRVRQFFDYQGLDEEGRKSANLNFAGFNGLTLDEALKHTKRDDFESAWSRVTSNTANDNDWDLLNRFNIWNPGATAATAPIAKTPEEQQQEMENRISEYGIDIPQANKYGLGFDNKGDLTFANAQRNRVYLFSDNSPITSGPLAGGGWYNGKAYKADELLSNPEIKKAIDARNAQVAKGDYNDTSQVTYWWDTPNKFRNYDPENEFFAPFHNLLKPEKDRKAAFAWLNNDYNMGDNEQAIAVQDWASGTNPITGMANKLKYITYNPQSGASVSYDFIKSRREQPDVKEMEITPWTNRYKGRERYGKLFTRGKYEFYKGENDNRIYFKEGDDYYLVRDLDVYDKIKNGSPESVNVSSEEIERMRKGTNDVLNRGLILKAEGNDAQEGYRHPYTTDTNFKFKSGGSDNWVKAIQDLDQKRTSKYGIVGYQYGGVLRGGSLPGVNVQGTILQDSPGIRDRTMTKVIGDGQGMTDTDKLELASMAADLAGLGLSFVPGAGNIAGGIAGVAGTGMQFAADVGRDGLDWGDVGRGALGLGMDALTFIPGLGTAAKAGKVVRNIRRAGNTVLKALAIGNASQAAVTAAQKIISGDKWTMNDLRTVVSGIQGGVAAGRSISSQVKAGNKWGKTQNKNIATSNKAITEGVGEGGLAKKATLKGLEDTAITKGKGKTAKTTTEAKEITKDVELKLNAKDIAEINALKGAEAKNKFIADKLKADHNFTPTSEQSKSLTDAFDIPKDKLLGVTIKGKNIGVNKKGKLEGEKIAPKMSKWQAYTQVSQGVKIKPSNKRTSDSAIEATQPLINRAARIKASKNPLAGPRSLWEVGQSPWRMLSVAPSGSGSQVALQREQERDNRYRAYQQGGLIQKYDTGGVTKRLEDMDAISDWGTAMSDFKKRRFSQGNLDILNKQHNSRLGIGTATKGTNVGTFQTDFNNPLLSGIIDHVAKTKGYGKTAKGAYDPNQNGAYNVDNRVGGVTRSWIASSNAMQHNLKAEDVENTSNAIFDPTANGGKGAYVFRNPNEAASTRPIFNDDSNVTPEQLAANNQMRTPALVGKSPEMKLAGISSTGQTGASNDSKGKFLGGFANLPKLGFDPDNAMAIGGLAMALGHNNRQANVMKKAIRTGMGAMESSPFEVYPRFSDYGVNAAYENAAQQQLNVKPATSDYLTDHAIRQDSQNRGEQLRLEGRLKTSELFSNYLGTTDELRRNYGAMRTDVANRNRQRMAQLNMALGETEAGRLANQYGSWNNFLMEKRNRLSQDKDKYDQYQNMLLKSDLSNDQQVRYKNAISKYESEFANATDKLPGESLENWALRTKPDVSSELNTINRNMIKQYGNANLDYYNLDNKNPNVGTLNNLFNIFGARRFAKGGKISSKSSAKSKSMNAAEHIWVNQNKDIADAVKQLNKNVITLFLKATT